MTVRQLLDFCRPLYPTWDDALARRLLTLLDLPDDRRIRLLSRGMRVKAALASSLACRPRLLVMDEPFGGLDPLMRDDVVRAVLELASEQPLSVLVSSHDLHDIEPLIDRLAYLHEGRLLIDEPLQTLQARVRQIEVVSTQQLIPPASWPAGWMNAEAAERALRFVCQTYRPGDTERDLGARFPGAQIQATPLSLRDTFIALARHARQADARVTPLEGRLHTEAR
jgi:ABC-2 type transport system ATP-binding protein